MATWRWCGPFCLRGRGQTCVTITVGPPWMCCLLPYALKWSGRCSKSGTRRPSLATGMWGQRPTWILGLQRWIPMSVTTTSQQAAEMAVHAPFKVILAICRLRGAAVAAGQGLCVCAPTAGALHLLGPSCGPVGTACPYATARQHARRSTGGRAATRRRAHGCVTSGRGRRLPRGQASSWSPCGSMDVGLAVSVPRVCLVVELAAG